MEFYLELIRTIFQAVDEAGKLRNRIVAFTASSPGEGVSYVVHTLAKEIATQTRRRVLAVDSQGLQNIRVADPHHISRHCSETQLDNVLTFPANGNGHANGHGNGHVSPPAADGRTEASAPTVSPAEPVAPA